MIFYKALTSILEGALTSVVNGDLTSSDWKDILSSSLGGFVIGDGGLNEGCWIIGRELFKKTFGNKKKNNLHG